MHELNPAEVTEQNANFETVRYMNEYFKTAMLLPKASLQGARVMTPANDAYKKFMAEPDDTIAEGYRQDVFTYIKEQQEIINSADATLVEKQTALLHQAHAIHLVECKMKL